MQLNYSHVSFRAEVAKCVIVLPARLRLLRSWVTDKVMIVWDIGTVFQVRPSIHQGDRGKCSAARCRPVSNRHTAAAVPKLRLPTVPCIGIRAR